MSSFDSGEMESAGGRLRCGGCDKEMDLLPGGQELGHADGTELCAPAEIGLDPVEVSDRLDRKRRLEARHLLNVEPWDEREQTRIWIADGAIYLILVALIVGCFFGVFAEWPR